MRSVPLHWHGQMQRMRDHDRPPTIDQPQSSLTVCFPCPTGSPWVLLIAYFNNTSSESTAKQGGLENPK